MKKLFLLFTLSLAVFFCSCVSPKQLQDVQAQRDAYEDKNAQLETEIASVKEQNKKAHADSEVQADRILQLQDSIALLQEELQMLNSRYANLMKMQEVAQKGNQKEMRKLLEQIQQNQSTLQTKEDELFKMERTLNERGAAVQRLSQDLDERNKRLIALERALQRPRCGNLRGRQTPPIASVHR